MRFLDSSSKPLFFQRPYRLFCLLFCCLLVPSLFSAFVFAEPLTPISIGRQFIGGYAPGIKSMPITKEFKKDEKIYYKAKAIVRRAHLDKDGKMTFITAKGTLLDSLARAILPKKSLYRNIPPVKFKFNYAITVDGRGLNTGARKRLNKSSFVEAVGFGFDPGTHEVKIGACAEMDEHPFKGFVDASLLLKFLFSIKNYFSLGGLTQEALEAIGVNSDLCQSSTYSFEVQAKVPNIERKTVEQATQFLSARKLKLIELDGVSGKACKGAKPGRIARQGVRAGQRRAAGSFITYRLCESAKSRIRLKNSLQKKPGYRSLKASGLARKRGEEVPPGSIVEFTGRVVNTGRAELKEGDTYFFIDLPPEVSGSAVSILSTSGMFDCSSVVDPTDSAQVQCIVDRLSGKKASAEVTFIATVPESLAGESFLGSARSFEGQAYDRSFKLRSKPSKVRFNVSDEDEGAPGPAPTPTPTPTPELEYFIFEVEAGASPHTYIGLEGVLAERKLCSFKGGGHDCTTRVTYRPLLGPFASIDDANKAFCDNNTDYQYWQLTSCKHRYLWQGSTWYWGCESSVGNALNNCSDKFD